MKLEQRVTGIEVELKALQLRVAELEKELGRLADLVSSIAVKAHILDMKLRNFKELEQSLEEAKKLLSITKELNEDVRKVLAEISDMQLRLLEKIEQVSKKRRWWLW